MCVQDANGAQMRFKRGNTCYQRQRSNHSQYHRQPRIRKLPLTSGYLLENLTAFGAPAFDICILNAHSNIDYETLLSMSDISDVTSVDLKF